MSRIWFRIGRFAIGSPLALWGLRELRTEQNVWRRHLWVFWWCSDTQKRPPILQEVDPATKTPVLLHWVDPADRLPVCGIPLEKAAWTIEWNYVSCAECREKGLPRKVQYDFSTR